MIIREEDTFVQISNKYIKDYEYILTNEELTILTLISMNLTVKELNVFTISGILDTLKYSRGNTRKVKEIKDIIQNFINDEVIILYNGILADDIITDITSIDKNDILYCRIEVEDDFTIIYDKEILELIHIANLYKLDIYSLINFVIYIYSFINNNELDEDYKLCYPSYSKINDDIGISETTIEKYINILQDHKIIECDYAGFKETTKGQIRNGKMFYCRYQDKDKLITRVDNERKRNGFIKQNKLSKNKSNIKRSLKQMINKLNNKASNNKITDIEKVRLELLKEEYIKLTNTKEEK